MLQLPGQALDYLYYSSVAHSEESPQEIRERAKDLQIEVLSSMSLQDKAALINYIEWRSKKTLDRAKVVKL